MSGVTGQIEPVLRLPRILGTRGSWGSDLGDDPHEGRHVVAEADSGVVVFLAVAGRAVAVALWPGVATFRSARFIAIG